jgi:hypothetical protein
MIFLSNVDYFVLTEFLSAIFLPYSTYTVLSLRAKRRRQDLTQTRYDFLKSGVAIPGTSIEHRDLQLYLLAGDRIDDRRSALTRVS